MKTLYPVRAVLRFAGRLPKETQTSGRHVIGKLGLAQADVRRWREPPHLVFANLPQYDLTVSGPQALLNDLALTSQRFDAAGTLLSKLIDLKAMEAFVAKYGVLRAHVDEATGRFDEDAANFTAAQDTLRRAWEGDDSANAEIKAQVEHELEARPSIRVVGIELTTENLWSLVCALFLLDRAAGRTGICGNPECPARYFLRKRKDQKFCERGECTAYAQRRYALAWWNREGQKRRKKGKPKGRVSI